MTRDELGAYRIGARAVVEWCMKWDPPEDAITETMQDCMAGLAGPVAELVLTSSPATLEAALLADEEQVVPWATLRLLGHIAQAVGTPPPGAATDRFVEEVLAGIERLLGRAVVLSAGLLAEAWSCVEAAAASLSSGQEPDMDSIMAAPRPTVH